MRKSRPKKFYSKEIFSAQLAKILEEKKINQEEFNQQIDVQQAVTRWKTGETSPSADSLLAIKNVFGVSIDQLLTGIPPPPTLQELSVEPYNSRTPTPINETLMADVLDEIAQVMKAHKIKLTKTQYGVLVKKVYDECAENKLQPDAGLVEHYLLLKGD